MQNQIQHSGPLLTKDGELREVGWSPQPILDCNLEAANFAVLSLLQFLRIKRWDYYAVFTPRRFFSATISDLGYAGNIFVYTLDFESQELHEEGLVIPLGRGIHLPRNSVKGETTYKGKGVRLCFRAAANQRTVSVNWPAFHDGRGIHAELRFGMPGNHESMNIVIPFRRRGFYLNRKINCLPVAGYIQYGEGKEEVHPAETLGSLDWGRGVWPYKSFWIWASASGYLANGKALGLNLGGGFGDTSAATENCIVYQGKVHKLGQVDIDYHTGEYMLPWKFSDEDGRIELEFTPFKERLARTNLGIIFSEVHQMFGRYNGLVTLDQGETLIIEDLVGFAEEHHARW